MAAEIVARVAERSIVDAFIERPADGPRALVLDGEAGIGKSTLWSAGVAAARQRYPNVLASRPAESERSLANVVLGDLFAELPAGVMAALPGPRRRAIERALLEGEADEVAVDPRALAAAVLSILGTLAAQGPVLLAIDDDQWADRSSVAALGFALRRLRAEPVRLMLARRADGGSAEGSGLDRAVAATAGSEAIERVQVGPLSIGAIQALLLSRLGVTLSRPSLVRLAEASGGNPFFALELARAQPRSGPPAPLVVPPNVERLVGRRLGRLDGETRRALVILAAQGRAPVRLLRQLGVVAHEVDRALAEQVIESSDGVVRFAHPLLASAVYQRASPDDRRAAHLRLAGAIEDPVSRAHHLALGTDDPDETAAATLEAAAVVARSRGLPIAAAELAEHAVRLTPAHRLAGALRRREIAARSHMAAGEASRARVLVAAQLDEAPAGPRRAEALILASELEEPGPAVSQLEEALREAAGDVTVEAAVRARLADVGRYVHGRDWAEQHVRAALAVAAASGDERLGVRALSTLAQLRFEASDPEALALAREAHRRATAMADPEAIRIATWVVGHQLVWLRRQDEARAWLEAALAGPAERDELLRAECLWYLALVELWAGRWDLAWEHAEVAAEVHAQYGIEQPQDHMPQAMIALHRGQFTLARSHSNRAISLAEGMMLPTHTAVLGVADLWSGRPDVALAALAHARELGARRGVREPGLLWVGRAEHVEAALQLGRADEAEALVIDWEAAASGGQHAWAMAEVIRSKGLLAAARGDLDEAAAVLEEAERRHEAVGDPFGRGRALLALGGVRRRQRQKRLARSALDEARAAFDQLGAESFSVAARRELGRLGGRRRLEGLSPSERRVAELVAEGHSNREIAATLFLGERTVASHLTHAYAKLGIRSRTELARRLADEAIDIAAESPPGAVEPTNIPTS